MPSTFTCPECRLGGILVIGDAIVCKSCGHEIWKTVGSRAKQLMRLEDDVPYELLFSDKKSHPEAVRQAESAFRSEIKTCRGFAEESPDAFLPHLSTALNNLGVLLFEEGRDGEAEGLLREGIEIQRGLVALAPDVFLYGLPQKLVNYADLLKRDGRFSEAIALYREALDLWTHIAAERSLTCLPEAAKAIVTIVTLLADTGRNDEAKEFIEMAHELRWAFREIKEVLQ